MTVKEVAEKLSLQVLAGSDGLDREVTGCYAGDLLSWVMARAQSGDIWLTVMGNVNAIAVASLTDSACILLTESAALDEDARARAEQQEIPVLTTTENTYQMAVQIAALLSNTKPENRE